MTPASINIQLRITALWAFSEAFLGGILHAFHLPFAGLILSSFAVLCMVVISINGYRKGQILKATILVMIVKALLSPHTPVSAYLAVLLQGAFGEFFFAFGIPFFLSCLFLGVSALLQSALQKLIILTLIFGVDFWKAVDEFLNSVNKMMGVESVSYSFYLLGGYLTLHLIAGVFVGIFASRLPVIFQTSVKEFAASKFVIPDELTLFSIAKKPRNKLIKPVFWILIFLVCFALYQVFTKGSIAFLFHGKAATFIFRSSLFLLVWYFFLAPVLLFVFQKWLAKQQSKFSSEVVRVLKLLPEMKYITEQCWLKTKESKGIMRLSKFIRFTFFMLLSNINAATHS